MCDALTLALSSPRSLDSHPRGMHVVQPLSHPLPFQLPATSSQLPLSARRAADEDGEVLRRGVGRRGAGQSGKRGDGMRQRMSITRA